jgi:hypothetical protein
MPRCRILPPFAAFCCILPKWVTASLAVSSEPDVVTGKRPGISLMINGMTNDTGLAKLGTSIGDFAQTGCNCVTNPGTLMGRHTLVYANRSVARGYILDHRVAKLRQEIEIVARR